jgi:hypothetical protein
LIIARCDGSRNTRGRGLPSCGSGVVPPTSTIAGPSANSGSGISACLSRPAEMPIGLEMVYPKI